MNSNKPSGEFHPDRICGTCEWNDNLVCDRVGRLISDEDFCEGWKEQRHLVNRDPAAHRQ